MDYNNLLILTHPVLHRFLITIASFSLSILIKIYLTPHCTKIATPPPFPFSLSFLIVVYLWIIKSHCSLSHVSWIQIILGLSCIFNKNCLNSKLLATKLLAFNCKIFTIIWIHHPLIVTESWMYLHLTFLPLLPILVLLIQETFLQDDFHIILKQKF